MDLFKIVPDNFFSLLNSPNKSIYVSCIIEAFKIYEEGSILGIDKKLVVEVLQDYLEHEQLNTDEMELENEEETSLSPREQANYVLRRMEECGWIDIDVTNDYVEVLNFRDYAITIVEALLRIEPTYDDYADTSTKEYRGYIYTIYALLTNPDNVEYSVTISEVYRNTKLFIRELRKLDSRLKDYIKSIVDKAEIKDLMDNLIDYKVELVDQAYHRLKTSDNVNKYRLKIVNKLEDYLYDDKIMEQIVFGYKERFKNADDAYRRASRDINEVIDIFNHLDEMVNEIDKKNKTYINSTIGKIEFLLKDDDNIPGKINTILNYMSKMHKKGKDDQACNKVQSIFNLKSVKSLNDNSIYVPRGRYIKAEAQKLLMDKNDLSGIESEFFKQYESYYTEGKVLRFVQNHLVNNTLKASDIINDNSTIEDVLMVIYALIYTNSNDEDTNYQVKKLDNVCKCAKFEFSDFMITKED